MSGTRVPPQGGHSVGSGHLSADTVLGDATAVYRASADAASATADAVSNARDGVITHVSAEQAVMIGLYAAAAPAPTPHSVTNGYKPRPRPRPRAIAGTPPPPPAGARSPALRSAEPTLSAIIEVSEHTDGSPVHALRAPSALAASTRAASLATVPSRGFLSPGAEVDDGEANAGAGGPRRAVNAGSIAGSDSEAILPHNLYRIKLLAQTTGDSLLRNVIGHERVNRALDIDGADDPGDRIDGRAYDTKHAEIRGVLTLMWEKVCGVGSNTLTPPVRQKVLDLLDKYLMPGVAPAFSGSRSLSISKSVKKGAAESVHKYREDGGHDSLPDDKNEFRSMLKVGVDSIKRMKHKNETPYFLDAQLKFLDNLADAGLSKTELALLTQFYFESIAFIPGFDEFSMDTAFNPILGNEAQCFELLIDDETNLPPHVLGIHVNYPFSPAVVNTTQGGMPGQNPVGSFYTPQQSMTKIKKETGKRVTITIPSPSPAGVGVRPQREVRTVDKSIGHSSYVTLLSPEHRRILAARSMRKADLAVQNRVYPTQTAFRALLVMLEKTLSVHYQLEKASVEVTEARPPLEAKPVEPLRPSPADLQILQIGSELEQARLAAGETEANLKATTTRVESLRDENVRLKEQLALNNQVIAYGFRAAFNNSSAYKLSFDVLTQLIRVCEAMATAGLTNIKIKHLNHPPIKSVDSDRQLTLDTHIAVINEFPLILISDISDHHNMDVQKVLRAVGGSDEDITGLFAVDALKESPIHRLYSPLIINLIMLIRDPGQLDSLRRDLHTEGGCQSFLDSYLAIEARKLMETARFNNLDRKDSVQAAYKMVIISYFGVLQSLFKLCGMRLKELKQPSCINDSTMQAEELQRIFNLFNACVPFMQMLSKVAMAFNSGLDGHEKYKTSVVRRETSILESASFAKAMLDCFKKEAKSRHLAETKVVETLKPIPDKRHETLTDILIEVRRCTGETKLIPTRFSNVLNDEEKGRIDSDPLQCLQLLADALTRGVTVESTIEVPSLYEEIVKNCNLYSGSLTAGSGGERLRRSSIASSVDGTLWGRGASMLGFNGNGVHPVAPMSPATGASSRTLSSAGVYPSPVTNGAALVLPSGSSTPPQTGAGISGDTVEHSPVADSAPAPAPAADGSSSGHVLVNGAWVERSAVGYGGVSSGSPASPAVPVHTGSGSSVLSAPVSGRSALVLAKGTGNPETRQGVSRSVSQHMVANKVVLPAAGIGETATLIARTRVSRRRGSSGRRSVRSEGTGRSGRSAAADNTAGL